MKIKTSELEGAALDWAVAKVEDYETVVHARNNYRYDKKGGVHCCELGCTLGPRVFSEDAEDYSPSTDWSQGGPLIGSRIYKIEQTGTHTWIAWLTDMQSAEWRFSSGPTPLIAAMRAIVASEMGDTVDVPEELS